MRICLVSDFFYPNFGGVETHILKLASILRTRGHFVIVITHYYDSRHRGVQILKNGLKVYYLSLEPFYNKCVFPTIVGSFPILYSIFKKENIQIVHGHSAFSTLAHEAIFAGSVLDLATVFTDHSLFGFATASAVVTNSFLAHSLLNASKVICVSHVGKINTVLRSGVPPEDVFVIPNGVDSSSFTPSFEKSQDKRIVVTLGCRLVYRKGIDLAVKAIPLLCSKILPGGYYFDFRIAGDGPKRILLEEMIEKYDLQSRVIMLGEVPMENVRQDLLSHGDIFLNTSLTEAFCMAIVEAASCGLVVVSTNVGGIPEVLPLKYAYLVNPDVSSIVRGVLLAAEDLINGRVPSKDEKHFFVAKIYNWKNVTKRTEVVYLSSLKVKRSLASKLRSMWEKGRLAGPLMACLFLFCSYWCSLLNFIYR